MSFSFSVANAAPDEPVVSVDGAFGCRGLNLSHWPGHTTPRELRHELSTGSALAFARAPERERARLADGCARVVNNHYDTDGACSAFALLHPELALARERELLDAAAAGDFFRAPSELAFAIDAAITNLADEQRSRVARAARALADDERHERYYAHVFEELPAWLAGDLRTARGLYELELDAHRADRALVARARRVDVERHDLTSWSIDEPLLRGSDPGRHALFGATTRDRVLVSFARERGHCHRLVVSTSSWFDIPGRARAPRPDLAQLALALDALDPHAGADGARWHAQAHESPSPELWFGRAALDFFSERNDALLPSALAPHELRAHVERWLDEHTRES